MQTLANLRYLQDRLSFFFLSFSIPEDHFITGQRQSKCTTTEEQLQRRTQRQEENKQTRC